MTTVDCCCVWYRRLLFDVIVDPFICYAIYFIHCCCDVDTLFVLCILRVIRPDDVILRILLLLFDWPWYYYSFINWYVIRYGICYFSIFIQVMWCSSDRYMIVWCDYCSCWSPIWPFRPVLLYVLILHMLLFVHCVVLFSDTVLIITDFHCWYVVVMLMGVYHYLHSFIVLPLLLHCTILFHHTLMLHIVALLTILRCPISSPHYRCCIPHLPHCTITRWFWSPCSRTLLIFCIYLMIHCSFTFVLHFTIPILYSLLLLIPVRPDTLIFLWFHLTLFVVVTFRFVWCLFHSLMHFTVAVTFCVVNI